MNKTLTISVLLLLCLLLVSAFQSIGINFVSAAEYGAGVFCPNNYSPDPFPYGAGDTEDELILSQLSLDYINDYLHTLYDGYVFYYWGDTDPDPPRSPTVTSSTYYNTLNSLQNYNSKVTVVSKGHCVPWGDGNHYKLLCTVNPDAAYDSTIWDYTGQCKTRFNFIWHCGTARSYPVSIYYIILYGPKGMPLCFTHNVAMSKYGGSGPCVFAGWDYQSPQFENKIPENDYWQWAQFAVGVFYYMRYYGWSLGTTLNQLSYWIYGVPFNYCPLYNDLVVWGNMNMVLTY
jgi:hypothetical protein